MIVDETGRKHVGFDAVIAFCRGSVLLFWMPPLLRLPAVYHLYKILYNKLAGTFYNYIILRQMRQSSQNSPRLSKPSRHNNHNSLHNNILLSNSNSLSSKVVDRKIYNRIKRRRWSVIKACVCTFFVVYVFFINAGNVYPSMKPPQWMSGIGYNLKLLQNWKMFSDVPQTDTWFIFKGHLQSGEVVDAFSQERRDPPVEKMANMADIYPSVRYVITIIFFLPFCFNSPNMMKMMMT
jgi:hypothetical protein